MKKRYTVCIHGHIGRLLKEEDCKIVKGFKTAVAFCEKQDDPDDWGFVQFEADKGMLNDEIKKMALKEIW